MEQGFDVEEIRRDFPILQTKTRNGKPLVYLDSAATSQKPVQVIGKIEEYYRNYNANIHRGLYEISVRSTDEYTGSKEKVARLINGGSYRNIIYCRNTTEAINLVALSWADQNISQDDIVLTTQMEHHSNIVPWQMLAKKKKARVEYAGLSKPNLSIDMEDYKEKLEHGPKLVAFSHVSNVLGTINDAKEMARLAHKHGAVVLVDGAQAVPHMKVDMKDIGADFYAFSSHKMLGPAGIGVLYGKEPLLEGTDPVIGGGDMIRSVRFDSCTWNELPWKFEAGTPNIEGGIGLGAAVDYIEKVGIERIRRHEIAMTKYALSGFEEMEGVEIYGERLEKVNESNKAGVISFNIKGVHPHDVASIFDSEGIAIRAGHHCAMPLVTQVIGEPAVARMSFYLYNTESDVDKAAEAVAKVKRMLKRG